MPVDRDQNRSRHHQRQSRGLERRPLGPARDPRQLDQRLGRDHAIHGEPADGQEEREEGAEVSAAHAEGAARRHHLGGAEAWTGAAEQPVEGGSEHRADGDRDDSLHDSQPEGDQQAAGDQGDEVGEGRHPEERDVARLTFTLR